MDDVVKLEYLVCGEILAPISVNAKEQFFLKCLECDEYFTMLEEFIMHYQYCHNDKFKMTMHSPDTSNAQYQREVDIQYADECQEDRDIHEENDVEEVKDENEENYEAEYALVNESQDNIDEDFGEEEVHNFKDSEGEDGSGDDDNEIGDNEIDDNEVDEDAEIEMYDEENDKADDDDELLQDADDSQEEYDDEGSQDFDRIETSNNDDEDPLEKTLQGTNSNNDVCHAEKSIEKTFSDCGDELVGEHSKSFAKEFLKCDLNYKAILFAYQNQPSLWNRNLFPNKLNNDERNLCLKNIALELKTARNIELDTSMVGHILLRIRQEYCVKLRRYKTIEQRKAAERNKIVPGWYFKQLAFLQPMMDHFTITKLDSQRTNLTKEQIIQILEIYKNFPVLWNTSLVENVCSNKRQEALERMLKPIHKEMGLKINVSILQQYLDSIHAHLSKEKTMLLKNNKNNENISMYYDHMKFLHDHVGPFCCGICGRRNRSPLHLKVHIYQKHNRNDPLRCPMCNKIYQQMEPYIAHARRHMNDLRVECKECGKRFIRHADLRVHMYTHTGIKSYCCEVCGSVFTTASALVDHKRRHEKLYKVFCEICSKGFYYDEKMREHMTTHTNIRNYACGICGKKFKAKKTLKAHKYTHEEGRNHPCPLCGKMYKNKIGVSQHLRTHRSNVGTKTKLQNKTKA